MTNKELEERLEIIRLQVKVYLTEHVAREPMHVRTYIEQLNKELKELIDELKSRAGI